MAGVVESSCIDAIKFLIKMANVRFQKKITLHSDAWSDSYYLCCQDRFKKITKAEVLSTSSKSELMNLIESKIMELIGGNKPKETQPEKGRLIVMGD